MSNMPILWQNALAQYRTEIARKAWVWFAETRGDGMQYAADRYANEVEHLVMQMRPMLESGFRAHGCDDSEVLDDLMRFILRRHANWRLGGNVNPTYCGVAE